MPPARIAAGLLCTSDRGRPREAVAIRPSCLTTMVRWPMTTTVSSKGQVVIPRHLREKYRLTAGVRLEVIETDDGLVLTLAKRSRPSGRQSGWQSLRGCAKGTEALKEHLAEHRREAKR